jgi:3'-phosphoadenosine 5'-phosphosulfate sulfotransferase (PAPS reductase)/FAD synthetase
MKVIKQEEDVVESRTIGWVSGGAASAVACWLALQKAREEGKEVPRFVRIDPLSEHEDTERFVKDLADGFGENIETISIHQYGAEGFADCKSHFDILRKVRYINGPAGAPCTRLLKREVRKRFEVEQMVNSHIWGFCKGEEARVEKMKAQAGFHYFPLIEHGLTKKDCFDVIKELGIELPMMYKLGFNTNNCKSCVKGGAGYWNHIRKHFPEEFRKMAELEREIGATCLRLTVNGKKERTYLDELDPEAGRHEPIWVADCGSSGEGCEIDLLRAGS